MAVYKSRKNQVEGGGGRPWAVRDVRGSAEGRSQGVLQVPLIMGTMEEFRDLWFFTSAVCTVQEVKL
jgi:hypothetical protein